MYDELDLFGIDAGDMDFWVNAKRLSGYAPSVFSCPSNGILFARSKISMGKITDGTTKVMMVGEQSDWGADAAGNQVDCRSSGIHGAWIGTFRPDVGSVGDWASDRVYNTTTIAAPMGTRFCRFISDYTGTEWYTGGRVGNGNRSPILSSHPGGAHLLLADGSVHFTSETIDFQLFRRLAVRDSGYIKSL